MQAASILFGYLFSAVVLAVVFSAFFCPWLAFGIKCVEIIKKKTFFNHMVRQILRLALWFGSLSSILILAVVFSGYYRFKKSQPLEGLTPEQLGVVQEAGVALPPDILQMVLLTGYFVLFILLLLLAHFAWNNLRGRNFLQLSLTLLIGITGSAAIFVTYLTLAAHPFMLHPSIFFSIFTWSWAIYPVGVPSVLTSVLMIGKILAGGIGIAANASLCGMIMRREKDNFGRDYYNFAANHAAKWMIATTVITACCGLAMSYLLLDLAGGKFELSSTEVWISALLYASCAIFGVAILRSQTPLRHKAGMWISLAALVVAMFGHLLFLRSFYFGLGLISGMIPAIPK